MERFGGFMQSPYTPSPGKCSRRIGPADAMVTIVVVTTKTQHTNNNF